jgi:BCD family chlorophyll transporter-like MFS transporter
MNSALNRVMINELALSATLVAVLASLPFLFSPIQVAIGAFSDRNPIFGYRRTPYIFIGLLFCAVGLFVSPRIAYLLAENFSSGIVAGILAFGAWGVGYNFATVSYFSLATEISGDKGRSRTIAVMFSMMIVSIIFTSLALSRMLDPFSRGALESSFALIGALALGLGFLGLINLEKRNIVPEAQDERHDWREMYSALRDTPQVMLFFRYLLLMLVAILGQDVLLEPYGAVAFDLTVSETTRITSIWGTFFLLSLSLGGALESRISKFRQARIGGWTGAAAFTLIVLSGSLSSLSLFYLGVVVLGLATGLATVSNLSLMLDMTTKERVGMFVGLWGMASALARLAGNVLSGIVRDSVAAITGNALVGFQSVFIIELLLLLTSLWLLRSINVSHFQSQAGDEFPYAERAAIAGESS